MSRKPPIGAALQRELLHFLRPPSRRLAQQVSEQVRPRLSVVARSSSGRPADEVRAALEEVVRSAGATPDLEALTEFAEQIEAGHNPFE
ncbi:hypothetical protein [Geodermatophilus ruber]|uniref:Uncharacterized protein n=1 Tax=Geodermatophilus ruber TaxID=504800 RepID=A0A1I3Z3T2_9ACTN|nr:hypothetical protein [Geodermatophilus ruber]SFK38301.1 hypothetical protein SAMN04488085_101316 [Geodermatophilus ruber]